MLASYVSGIAGSGDGSGSFNHIGPRWHFNLNSTTDSSPGCADQLSV